MIKFKKKKIVRVCATLFVGTMLFTTVAQASSITKKIDATFRGIKMFYNNQQKSMTQEPFIYNGSVYLPVRAVADLVDKNIEWNGATNSVYIADKPGSVSNTVMQQLQNEIASKNFEIVKLNSEKALLEEKIKLLEGSGGVSGDLKKTLTYLEDEFDYDYSINWEFKLSQTSSRINLEVSFDSRTDGRRWDNLSASQRNSFFRDICREIRADHKDIVINGKVIDSRTNTTVGSFSYSKSNSFSYTGEQSYSFSDLEKDLLKSYKKIDDSGNIYIDNIKLEGDEDNIIFTVTVNLDTLSLEREWDGLSNSTIRDLMWAIEDDIKYDYRYATVEGYIEDYAYRNEMIASYENGSVRVPRRR